MEAPVKLFLPLLVLLPLLLPAGTAHAQAPEAEEGAAADLFAEARAAREATVEAGSAGVLVGWPRVGDQGRFEARSDGEAQELPFAWRPARFPDEWGRMVDGVEVAYDDGGGARCTITVDSPVGDAEATTVVELPLFGRYAGEPSPVATVRPFACFAGAFVNEEGVRSGGSTRVAYGDWRSTLCLFRHALQGTRVEPGAPLASPACGAWGEGEWFAGPPATRHGFPAIPAYHLAAEGASVSRMWLVDGLAYPLEVERHVIEEGRLVRYATRLVALAADGDPLPEGPREAPPTLDLPAPDPLLGPDDADARLPLRLSDAARAAVQDPTLRDLQALLADPDAALAGALMRATQPQGAPAPVPRWTLVYAAPGRASLAVECEGAATPLPTGALARCHPAALQSGTQRLGAIPPDFGASMLPPRMASFALAVQRWEAADPNASASPLLQALYRPWSAEDFPAALVVGTLPDQRPGPVAGAAPSRAETSASLDPATGATRAEIASFALPLRVTDLPAGLQAPAALSPAPASNPGPSRAPLLVASGVAAAAGALVALLLFWSVVKSLLLALFTRLARARVLDSDVRAAIHDLVLREPGIHASAIVERLGRRNGVGEYHLHVLVREGFLATLGSPGFRRYFVAGRHSPAQMRALAALREGAGERVYALVRERPGIPLHEVAELAGIRAPYASKTVKRLAEAGLVERVKDGRIVRLKPLGTAPPVDLVTAS